MSDGPTRGQEKTLCPSSGAGESTVLGNWPSRLLPATPQPVATTATDEHLPGGVDDVRPDVAEFVDVDDPGHLGHESFDEAEVPPVMPVMALMAFAATTWSGSSGL